MSFINGRFYANPAYGRALELARIAEQLTNSGLLRSTNSADQTGDNVIEGVPSLDIKSLLRAGTEQDSDHPSGFCELEPRFWVEGPECEEGKDYHATAFMRLAGPGIQFKEVVTRSIKVRANTDSEIVTVDSPAEEAFGGPLEWQVKFSIKSCAGCRQQGGTINWTVTYKCRKDELEMTRSQGVVCR